MQDDIDEKSEMKALMMAWREHFQMLEADVTWMLSAMTLGEREKRLTIVDGIVGTVVARPCMLNSFLI